MTVNAVDDNKAADSRLSSSDDGSVVWVGSRVVAEFLGCGVGDVLDFVHYVLPSSMRDLVRFDDSGFGVELHSSLLPKAQAHLGSIDQAWRSHERFPSPDVHTVAVIAVISDDGGSFLYPCLFEWSGVEWVSHDASAVPLDVDEFFWLPEDVLVASLGVVL